MSSGLEKLRKSLRIENWNKVHEIEFQNWTLSIKLKRLKLWFFENYQLKTRWDWWFWLPKWGNCYEGFTKWTYNYILQVVRQTTVEINLQILSNYLFCRILNVLSEEKSLDQWFSWFFCSETWDDDDGGSSWLSHLFMNSGRPVILPAFSTSLKYGDGSMKGL